MRELIYYVAVSLDGCIASADGGFDAFPTEGDHMAVVLGEYADALPAHVLRAAGINPPGTRFDTVIQGWTSYSVALDAGIERPYAHLREIVATRRHTDPPEGVTFTADALATVRALKREEGLGIYLCGGGALAGALLPEIDRLVLKRNPVVLPGGIPMLGREPSAPAAFSLESERVFDSGVVISDYVRADR